MFSRHRYQDQRGFTLAEILVTTAIFAIIMLAALAVYDRSNQVFKTGTEAADMQQSTRIGFDKLVSDVRMAGFDYSRGGVPTQTWQATQPDEQIEYAGPTAAVFRANFNYNSAASQGNGLEPAYTPVNVLGQAIFPYVTTSNQEIIAYVLRSTNAAANTGSISFWVDSYRPRAGFPSNLTPAPAGSNPSQAEAQVVINGIDITNNNPPYTLYRVTIADGNCNGPCTFSASQGTPVAENLRSLEFKYYTDLSGTALLKTLDGSGNPVDITDTRNADGSTVPTSQTGAIGGDGRYDPAAPGAVITDRLQRAQISAVRVSLVGMNASPDLQGYTNATETIPAIKSYRQYALSSLVVPRNLGLTGFPEPSFTAPAPPTIVGMCTGHCGAPIIYWQPPTSGGTVLQYRIEWDTNQNGAYSTYLMINDPSLTQAIIPDDGLSDVSLTYYYRMESINENGQSPSSGLWQAVPKNKTKPMPPTNVVATGAQTNRIPLQWNAPGTNVIGSDVLACSGTGGSTNGSAIPPQEMVKFRVSRGTTAGFDPTNTADSAQILGFTSASQPPLVTGGAQVNWNDSGTNSAFYPANCVPYYYRVAALDRCYKMPNWNESGSTSVSDYSGVIGPFQSTSNIAPAVASALSVDKTSVDSNGNLMTGCPDPSNLSSPNCRVKLAWQPVITDTASPANVIGIDRYVITRRYRLQPSGGVYLHDVAFGTAGSLEINCSTGTCTSGFSQQSPSSALSFVDYPPFLEVNSGQVLEYQYTIASKNCSLYSGNPPNGILEAQENSSAQTNDPPGPNAYVAFPGCSTNPAIVQAGAQNFANGSAGGDSPATAWIFNTGDTVTVTPAAGSTVMSVVFQLFAWPTPNQIGLSQTILAPGPYGYTWSDQPGTSTFTLRITLNTIDAQGQPCQEVHVKYIQQQAPAGCFINTGISPPAPVPTGHGNNPETDHIDFTITNNGTENIYFNSPTVQRPTLPAFHGNMDLTWQSPDLPNHTDMQFVSVVWGEPGVANQTDSICAYGLTCTPTGGTISSITTSGTIATATTSAAHGLITGDTVTINNVNPAGFGFDGTKTVTVVNSTRFTYSLTTSCSGCSGSQVTNAGMLYSAQRKLSRAIPLTLNREIQPGQSATLRVNFSFNGTGGVPSLPASPSAIVKLCLQYRIGSEQTITKNCSVVGTTTNNPTSCN